MDPTKRCYKRLDKLINREKVGLSSIVEPPIQMVGEAGSFRTGRINKPGNSKTLSSNQCRKTGSPVVPAKTFAWGTPCSEGDDEDWYFRLGKELEAGLNLNLQEIKPIDQGASEKFQDRLDDDSLDSSLDGSKPEPCIGLLYRSVFGDSGFESENPGCEKAGKKFGSSQDSDSEELESPAEHLDSLEPLDSGILDALKKQKLTGKNLIKAVVNHLERQTVH